MKFAFCLYKYFRYGGLQRDFLRIAEEALLRGHTVEAYCYDWQDQRTPHFPVHIIPTKGLTNHQKNAHFAKQLTQALQQTDYDAILGFNKLPHLDFYYAADTSYVAKVQKERSFLSKFTSRYWAYRRLELSVFKGSSNTHILALADQTIKEYQSLYQLPEDQYSLLPPGIDPIHQFNTERAEAATHLRSELKLTQHNRVLLFIGSGFKTKGLDRTLQAIANLPSNLKESTRLLVIGNDKFADYQALAKQLNIEEQIIFIGPQESVLNYLYIADYLIHPAYRETAGIVLLEALVAGLPVITTDVCGYAHHIQKAQAGYVLPSPFSQEALNSTLEHALTKVEWPKLHSNAIQYGIEQDLYSLPGAVINILETKR